LLEHYSASPRLIALTHPHRDAAGVADIVDAFTQGPADRWPKIGLLWPTPRDRVNIRDLQAYFTGGIVEDALSAIRDRWRRRLLPAPPSIVVGMARMPGTVRLAVTSPLAFLSPSRSLPITYARIGLEPPPAL
jgi:hypothetical protein